jgi:hypothetical protein
MTKGEGEQKANEAPQVTYTGQGFIPLNDLVDSVKAWQQRKVLCEDVDFLDQKGGRA